MGPVAPANSSPSREAIREAYGRVPLHFEENRGQVDGQVRFLARGQGYRIFLTQREVVLGLRGETLRMSFIDASPTPEVHGAALLPGKVNYLVGSGANDWRTDVATYGRVQYRSLYPGIDAVFYGNQRRLEYDLVVRPGADPDRVRLRIAGAQALRVDDEGDLHIVMRTGTVVQHRPVIYQDIEGGRRSVRGDYVVQAGEVRIKVAAYDPSRPLVIDPVLSYSTFLGGTADDDATGVAVDAAGNAVVVGPTLSSDFPVVNAHDSTRSTARDAFITKINAAGTTFTFSTFLGGAGGATFANAVALDGSGNIYLTGRTHATAFPTTAGAFQTVHKGATGTADAFVTKLNPAGNALVYSTFLGGTNAVASATAESGHAIAVDSAGHAYVAGATAAADFPTTAGSAKPALSGDGTTGDAFVAKLNPAGSGLLYSTFLGGTGVDVAYGLAVEDSGNAYVVGSTTSAAIGTTTGALKADAAAGSDPQDAFVVKLSTTGSNVLYATRFGGSGTDEARAVDVDAAGNAYITGLTASSDLPVVNAAQSTSGGNQDAFVAKLNPTGTGLAYSTYLGGSDSDAGYGIAVDSAGAAHVTGATNSPNFPSVNPLPPEPGAGGANQSGSVFVTKLSPGGALGASGYSVRMAHSTVPVQGRAISLDAQGNAYVAGHVTATFPTTPGAPLPQAAGGDDFDAFIAKIAPGTSAGGTDTVAPAVSITKPANGVWTGGSIGVSTSATDNVALASIKLWGNGGVFGTIDCKNSPTCSGGVTWLTGPLPAAAYEVNAVATDTAGNQTKSATITIFKDAKSPVVPSGATATGGGLPPLTATITAPANGSTVTGSTTVGFAASGAQGKPVFVLKVDNTGVLYSGNAPGGASSASTPWDTHLGTNGSHTLNLTVQDEGGRMATAMVTVTVANSGGSTSDTQKPSISLTAPSNGVWTGNSINVGAQATDNVAVAQIKLWGNGGVFGTIMCGGATCNGAVSWATGALPPGAYEINAMAVDTAGNQAVSTSITIYKDAVSPFHASGASTSSPALGAAFAKPSNGATLSGPTAIQLNATGVAAGSTLTYALKIDGAAPNAQPPVTGACNQSTCVASWTWDTTTATNGSHTLTGTVNDTAGHTATTTIQVTVANTTGGTGGGDTTAPSVAVTKPANGAWTGSSIGITASGTDNVGLASIAIYGNGTLVQSVGCSGTASCGTGTVWWSTGSLPPGKHTITAVATDTAGNTKTSAPITINK